MNPSRWSFPLLLAAVALFGAATGPDRCEAAGPKLEKPTREIGVEPVNEAPGWLVRVSVPREDRTFKVGDLVTVNVVSEQDGYLYLFDLDADGQVGMLFPNSFQNDNKIAKKTPVTVPDPNDKSFTIVVSADAIGKETIWAVVTKDPAPELAKQAVNAKGGATLIPADKFRDMLTRLATGEKASKGVTIKSAKDDLRKTNPKKYARQCLDWSEDKIEITTVKDRTQPGPAKRVGLFVGVSEYADPGIRQLTCSHTDAINMEKVMKNSGAFASTTLLLNKDATLQAIRNALTDIVSSTGPGDTVLIYWSGHGGSCSNTDPNDPEALEAYLVPHDGQLDDTFGTMLTDKTFGRWIQELDGRRVMVILDTCHSGGQIEGMKDVKKAPLNRDGTPKHSRGVVTPNLPKGAKWKHTTFLEGQKVHFKAIGQRDAAVLAACTFNQFSFEREDQQGGVMTYALVDRIGKGSGSLTIDQAFDDIKDEVGKYVDDHYPGSPQTPVLSDKTPDPKTNTLRP